MNTVSSDKQNVIIIGGGAAGLSAAIYLARAGLQPLVLAGSPPGGQLMLTSEVENFPGRESILGGELIEVMRKQAQTFGGVIIDENVKLVVFDKTNIGYQQVETASGKTYQARAVLIATGAKALWLGLPSEARLRGKGVSACATCDGFFFKNKTVAVIGGGDSALEEALTLTKFAKNVILIHRKPELRASKIMQERVKKNSQIHLLLNTEIVEVVGESRVQGLRIKIKPTDQTLLTQSEKELEAVAPAVLLMKIEKKEGEYIYGTIPVDGVFVAIGHRPDTDLFKGQIELDEKGYVMTTNTIALENFKLLITNHQSTTNHKLSIEKFDIRYGTQTSVRGVFGAGDCVDYIYKQASTAAGMGVQAALDTERWLENK